MALHTLASIPAVLRSTAARIAAAAEAFAPAPIAPAQPPASAALLPGGGGLAKVTPNMLAPALVSGPERSTFSTRKFPVYHRMTTSSSRKAAGGNGVPTGGGRRGGLAAWLWRRVPRQLPGGGRGGGRVKKSLSADLGRTRPGRRGYSPLAPARRSRAGGARWSRRSPWRIWCGVQSERGQRISRATAKKSTRGGWLELCAILFPAAAAHE